MGGDRQYLEAAGSLDAVIHQLCYNNADGGTAVRADVVQYEVHLKDTAQIRHGDVPGIDEYGILTGVGVDVDGFRALRHDDGTAVYRYKGGREFYDRALIVGELDGIVHFDMPA